ncbi:MAG: metallophosphoesterase family protein [Eubacteriales bacterium]|nr:metallophosphoesterase family protein [Eubacteriales bacterium]
MKIALVSDLHGNMTAVRALEEDLDRRQVDTIWCLGDIVGKGPNSHLTFDWAIRHCEFILRGNWDEGIGLREFKRDGFYYSQLGEARMAALLNFQLEKLVMLSGRRIRLIHGRPIMDKLYYIQDPKELWVPLLGEGTDLLIYADCHRQGLRTLTGQVANIGSVGNAMGVPLAQYAILEGESGESPAPLDLTFVTLPYNKEEAVAEALAQPDLPDLDAYINELRTGVYSRKKGSFVKKEEVL